MGFEVVAEGTGLEGFKDLFTVGAVVDAVVEDGDDALFLVEGIDGALEFAQGGGQKIEAKPVLALLFVVGDSACDEGVFEGGQGQGGDRHELGQGEG